MSGGAKAAPPAPDPVATARAQAEFNSQAARETAALNRVDQLTPQGDSRWRQAPGTGQWENVVSYSPEQQRLYDASTQGQEIYARSALQQLGNVEGRLSQPFEYSGPDITTNVQDRSGNLQYGVNLAQRPDYTGLGDPNQSREAVQQALLARINPDLERERAALESRLANQGITMGSQAWNTGMQDYSRQANDARYGAILNAGDEQSRMFGLGMQQAGFGNDARMQQATFGNQAVQQAYGMDIGRATFGNQARQQSLQEQLALRAQPINEASALLTGGQVQNPQFNPVAQVGVQAPDYAGGVGQNYAGAVNWTNGVNQRQGANNAAMGSAAGAVGGAAIAAIIA